MTQNSNERTSPFWLLLVVAAATGACQRSAPTPSGDTTAPPAAAATTTAAMKTTGTTTSAQGAPAASVSTLSATVSTEDAALAAVLRGLTAQGHDPSCVSFITSRADGQIEVEAREKHGGKCKGDPATAPVIGRYRVGASGDLSTYDVVEDAWIPAGGVAKAGGGGSVVGTKVLEREVKDASGRHRFVLSLDRHGRTAHLYAYDFCDSPPSAGAPCWTIQDGIDNCADDLSVDFVGDKLYLREAGGQTTAAVLYRTRCSSDVSAYTMKLVGYDHAKKFAVRGTTGLRGEFEPKRTADVPDAALRSWALGTWDKHAIDKL